MTLLGTDVAHRAASAVLEEMDEDRNPWPPAARVLAVNSESFAIGAAVSDFAVGSFFSESNPDIALHEPPPDFMRMFGDFIIPPRNELYFVRQLAVLRAVTVSRVRAEFEGPCHLDCRALYFLLRIHFMRGDVVGGLSVGDPALPHANALFLLDGEGNEHPVSLVIERSCWRIHMDAPHARLSRFSEHDKVFVPDSAMQFRRG